MVGIETGSRIPIWHTFGRIQWHVIPEPHATLQGAAIWLIQCVDPRATCHPAWCCHLVNSMSCFQSHVLHCRVVPPGKFSDMSSPSHALHCRVLPPSECNVVSSQSHVSHYTVLPTGEFNVMSPQSQVSHCRVLPPGKFNMMIPKPHATLRSERIPSAILRVVFCRILLFACGSGPSSRLCPCIGSVQLVLQRPASYTWPKINLR